MMELELGPCRAVKGCLGYGGRGRVDQGRKMGLTSRHALRSGRGVENCRAACTDSGWWIRHHVHIQGLHGLPQLSRNGQSQDFLLTWATTVLCNSELGPEPFGRGCIPTSWRSPNLLRGGCPVLFGAFQTQ